ncbi:MAG TPA: YfhO family protein [Verrucomicrobiota bacterium]|nr:YfhO family protein [Verrucomicrobiota bacterium]
MNDISTTAPRQGTKTWVTFLVSAVCLTACLALLFGRSFKPDYVAFSNDGPLGIQNSSSFTMPDGFGGVWLDLYWIGSNGGYAQASPTYAMLTFLGPIGYAKFYEPLSLLILGLCAWAFFRSIGLKPVFCTLGAIAAALNSNFFSNTCWGLGSRALTLSFIFLALAALNARRIGKPWLNAILAGLAVGMAVVEGADNGVIFSLFVAAFVVFQSFVVGSSFTNRITRSLRLVLVAGFALFIAVQSLITLFGFASAGAVKTDADPNEKERKWIFATQWSLPPAETLRVIIPGLYGYRMDAPDGGTEKVYWGRVGEYAPNPEVARRFSGSGEYAGLLVVLLALWAVAASFSRSVNNVYSPNERKFIWFWASAVLISVVLSWGRFAPFYQFVYALPYFSSIRNPMKFMHPAHMGLMILFGYGLLGLARRYLESSATPLSIGSQLKSWWSKAVKFEKGWTWTLAGVTAFSTVAWLFYNASTANLTKHLMASGYPEESHAEKIAQYSAHEVGLYAFWLVICGVTLLLVMGGVFGGKRARWAAVLLGLILIVDLGRANLPWIVHWNYKHKYATNPIVDILRDKPYNNRVVAPPFLMDSRAASSLGGYNQHFPSLYGIEWVQHHFPYYNIQSLDVAQDPRPPADKEAYMRTMRDPARYWQLTNTRYILGMTGFLDALNQQLDKGQNRFHIATTFVVEPKPGVQPRKPEDLTAVAAANGPWALFEFTGALPRTKLYSQWQVSTNDDDTLKSLSDPAFDPWAKVIVSDAIAAAADQTNAQTGSAEIVNYKPQRIEIRAAANAPSVLLLNDRYDTDWRVSVDGKPATLLRCNYIMRGVQLEPGEHTVVFTFEPSLKGLKISLVAIALGFVLCALLFFVRQDPHPANTPASKAKTDKT